MNSLLPIPQCEQQEMVAIQEQLSSTHHNVAISWPKVDTDPLNEYNTPFLATMAFPTLFPDVRVTLQTHLFTKMYHLEKQLSIF